MPKKFVLEDGMVVVRNVGTESYREGCLQLLHNLSIRKNGRNRSLTEFITKNSLVIPCNKWGWVSNPGSPHKGDQAMALNYKALGKQNR